MEVRVINNNVEKALKVAKKKLAADGLFRELKARRFYQKPSVKKRKLKSEKRPDVDKSGCLSIERFDRVALPKSSHFLLFIPRINCFVQYAG